MTFISDYNSPLGKIVLASDGENLIGLWFDEQKYFGSRLLPPIETRELPIFLTTKRWLDAYFAGENPDFVPPLRLIGTPFQQTVWQLLQKIPYGQTTTYGNLSREICKLTNRQRMSAQAIGGAVGRNPISLIVPCHRVVGANGALIGYAGGIERKQFLLELER